MSHIVSVLTGAALLILAYRVKQEWTSWDQFIRFKIRPGIFISATVCLGVIFAILFIAFFVDYNNLVFLSRKTYIPWAFLTSLVAAPSLILIWYWREIHKRQDVLKGKGDIRIAKESQYASRFTDAMQLLGSEKIDLRIGAIYSLEQISKDYFELHWPIVETLAGFIRNNAQANIENNISLNNRTNDSDIPRQQYMEDKADVQAALTVLGRRCHRDKEKAHQIVLLHRTDLRGVILNKAHLERINLMEVNLEGAYLQDAHLNVTYLVDANMREVILDNANINGAFLSGADLTLASINNASLIGTDLDGSEMSEAKLNDANLTEASLNKVDLSKSSQTNTILVNAKMHNAKLREAQLNSINMTQTILTGADLSGAHFDGGLLAGANMQKANLENVQIEMTFMNGTNLEGANLKGAHINKAIAIGANFSNANLENIHIQGTYYNSENLVVEKLNYPPTKFSHEFNPEKHGMIDVSIKQ